MKSLLLTSISAAAVLTDAAGARPVQPVVVELFQSQGCSSCPPASANLNALAGRADVIALSSAVTYWDQLGWKDTFATPADTARQWDYAHAAGRGQVATPQMVINGDRATIVGSHREQLDNRIAAVHRSDGPTIAASNGKVLIGRGASTAPATVWLVRYDPRQLSVPIGAGENGGRTLLHRNIVRQLQSLGISNGQPVAFTLPADPDAIYRTAVLVQPGKGGPIAAAAKTMTAVR